MSEPGMVALMHLSTSIADLNSRCTDRSELRLKRPRKRCCGVGPKAIPLLASLLVGSLIGIGREAKAANSLAVDYAGCAESIGVTTVARAALASLLPSDYGARYGFGGFGSIPGSNDAQIIIRSVRCDNASLNGADLGTVINSQIGVITARSDAEDLDGVAANGIDNFQLEFATSSDQLAAAMGALGIAAIFDTDLSLTFTGNTVSNNSSPLFTATGSHDLPTVPSPGGFIAHWWSPTSAADIQSRQVIPAIDFNFGGNLAVTPGSSGPLLALLGPGSTTMDIPLGGRFASGPVTFSVPSVPGPLPISGAAAAWAWSRRLRRRLGSRPSGSKDSGQRHR